MQNLMGELDAAVFPVGWPNAGGIGFVAPLPPVTRGLANIASAPERANLDDSRLFYRATPVASPPAHNRNPLEIAIFGNTPFVGMYLCCASPKMGIILIQHLIQKHMNRVSYGYHVVTHIAVQQSFPDKPVYFGFA
jgi:hypothetical protein